MKKCKNKNCLTNIEDQVFSKCKLNVDGLQKVCKVCATKVAIAYSRTLKGFIVKVHQNQKHRSKHRGHPEPNYSRPELFEWILTQPTFLKLFDEWVESGYIRNLAPSLDRLDDSKPYSFSNIQIMTWKDNDGKQHFKRYSKLATSNMPHKRVTQLTLDGAFIAEFNSVAEAGRDTNVNYKAISACTLGNQLQAGGFQWVSTKT